MSEAEEDAEAARLAAEKLFEEGTPAELVEEPVAEEQTTE
jgi:hypothetical protein